jgi:hypothetical protein
MSMRFKRTWSFVTLFGFSFGRKPRDRELRNLPVNGKVEQEIDKPQEAVRG